MLLALARERLVLAGVAAGVVGADATRVRRGRGARLAAAFLVGTWRDRRPRRRAARPRSRLALPALAIAGRRARLVRGAGRHVAPLDREPVARRLHPHRRRSARRRLDAVRPRERRSGCSRARRVYGGAARRARGQRAALARAPRSRRGSLALLAAGRGGSPSSRSARRRAARGRRASPPSAAAIEHECTHLLIGMSWLPALGFGVAAYAAVRFAARAGARRWSGTWAVDLALVVAAAALGLRAYNAFTAEGSYAPYYAAPLVLLLAHPPPARRGALARRARPAALAALGARRRRPRDLRAGRALRRRGHDGAHAARHVRDDRGRARPRCRPSCDRVDATHAPGEPILAAPVRRRACTS